ncbi:MAG: hypothetical protein ACOYXC_02695 [Candidatus Rifleibacteriota bacterium]
MKKVISVLILVAFIGSMIVMTGCFGGDDGLGIGLAVFALAIIVSSGGAGAPTVFAANTRADIRYALSEAVDKSKVTIKIFPLKDGVEQGTGTEIPATDITWDTANGQLKATPQISQLDGYNEYRVKVFYNGTTKLLEGVKYLKTADKTGTQNLEVNPTSTAKALVFDTWKNKATTDTYQTFEFNLGNTDISALVTQVTNEFAKTTSAVAPDYTTAAVTTEVNTVNNNTPTAEVVTTYTISGFVTAADGLSGQTDAMMTLYRKADRQMIAETRTNAGNYTLTNVPDGTYVLIPTKANHSYNPLEREVTVNGANLTGINFQATFAPSVR